MAPYISLQYYLLLSIKITIINKDCDEYHFWNSQMEIGFESIDAGELYV
jgi:hypothetical protein